MGSVPAVKNLNLLSSLHMNYWFVGRHMEQNDPRDNSLMEFSDLIRILVDFSTSGSTTGQTARTLELAPLLSEECYSQQERSIF